MARNKLQRNALQENRSLQARGSVAVVQGIKRLVTKLMTRDNILALDKGRRRLFEHMRSQGEQVETLWESGKTIGHLTREES